MGHLINPVAFRLGWFSGWCDSWYTDHLYYPEFLHDIFRVRLFLNYFFSLTFFEKGALTFSHFEFFHKYTFLTLRVFYYDGVLMEGLFSLQGDLSNLYLRRRFRRYKRRHGKPLGSRYGRIFLAIFFNVFRFSDFFKSTYFRRSFPQKSINNGGGPSKKKTLSRARSFRKKPLSLIRYEQAQKRFVLRLKARLRVLAKEKAQKEGKFYVLRRERRKRFFTYNKLFKVVWRPRRFFRGKGTFRTRRFNKFHGNSRSKSHMSFKKQRWQPRTSFRDKPRKAGQQSLQKGSRFGIFNNNASKKRVHFSKGRSFANFNQVAPFSVYNGKADKFEGVPSSTVSMDKNKERNLASQDKKQNNNPKVQEQRYNPKISKEQGTNPKAQEQRYNLRFSKEQGVNPKFSKEQGTNPKAQEQRYNPRFSKEQGVNPKFSKEQGTNLKAQEQRYNPRFSKEQRYNPGFFNNKAQFFKHGRGPAKVFPVFVDRAKILHKRRRRKMRRLFKFTLRYCRLGKLHRYLRALRVHFAKGLPLVAELKIFLIFVVLFRRVWFLFKGNDLKLSKFDFLKEFYFTASFLFFYNGYSFKVFSNILAGLLKQAGLHYMPIRVGTFLISNDTITALFLANFVGRKLVQGYRVRAVLSPVMHDLYKSSRSINPPKVGEVDVLKEEFFSKGFRSGVAKSFILKFFFIYKRLYGKFFWLQYSWLNFYAYKNLVFFLERFAGDQKFAVGASQKFMLQKHGLLFFFNFDNAFLTKDLPFVFNELFFDFTNRSMGHSLFFFFICDDLFSHGNVLFFGQSWKKLSMDQWYASTLVFFNRLVRYSYWRYNRNWLFEVNGINKLKMRARKPFKKQGLLGFKFHLRGRFSRKQKASSLWYVRGQLPLTLSSANIDYAFRAYPLKNSLVSIKVWLYKSILAPQWFVRQF